MDIFYVSVLSIAVIVLILILTYVGIMLAYSNSNSNKKFPPVSNSCPDYWMNSNDGSGCIVPKSGSKNCGKLYDSNGNPSASLIATDGYDKTTSAIDFSIPKWKANGTMICNKQKWAEKNGVIWDGVSNYNSCSTSTSKPDK